MSSVIEWNRDFFDGWMPSSAGSTLLALAMSIYSIDKLTSRAEAGDAWTRDIQMSTPDLSARLESVGLSKALTFLSGDTWQVASYPAADPLFRDLASANSLVGLELDAVSLFSGGLDSLCGVIDYLESNPGKRLGLVAHYEGGQVSPRQKELAAAIGAHYGDDRIVLRRFRVRPAPRNAGGQFDVVETSTRARSFLFVSAALALANSVSETVPVIVPENGYIALNVPLTRARVGSFSTRTTHPHYLQLLHAATAASGISNPIHNPYEFKTKGEMVRESPNQALLRQLAGRSISCSHPEVGRWGTLKQGNCGYCFPCIIRQSSLSFAGYDRGEYTREVLSDPEFVDERAQGRGADLRAVVNAVYADRPDRDIFRNGPVTGNLAEYLGVWRRGNDQIRSWLELGARGELARVIKPLRR